jgi:F0F1-type ATP synthase assembly protein I
MPSGKAQSAEQLRILWRIAGMAFMVSAEVGAGALIGWVVDRWRGADGQVGLLVGGIAGIIVGIYGFVRAAFRLTQGRPSSRDGPGREPGGDSRDSSHS